MHVSDFLMPVMQQRAPPNQGGIKEEKLPPSPVMRGEPFNPAMRPDHHKHPDIKPSQPGHSQQSEYHDYFCGYNAEEEAAQDIETVCVCALVSSRCEVHGQLATSHPLL